VVKCSEVLQCIDGTSNKVSNMIRSHIDNRKLLLTCILLLTHSLIFLCFFFYQYMVAFLFNIVIYVFLLKESMYSYCCLCILIAVNVFLLFVHVFLPLSMYTYFCLCILKPGYPDWGFPCFFLGCKVNARV
jgi:hypothetical protein